MVILIEGVSRCGKSQLANIFSQEFNCPVYHNGKPPTADPYNYFLQNLKEWTSKNSIIVVDRLHLTNYSYQNRFGGLQMDSAEWHSIDLYLMNSECFMFLLIDDPFEISKRSKQKLEEQPEALIITEPNEIAEVQIRFFRAFEASQIAAKGSFSFRQFVTEDGEFTQQYYSVVNKIKEVKN